MAKMTKSELNGWQLKVLLGGLGGGVLGVGIAFGIAKLLLVLDIWPFDSSNMGHTAIPVFAVWGLLVLLVVCPLCLGTLGMVLMPKIWQKIRGIVLFNHYTQSFSVSCRATARLFGPFYI